MKTITKLAKSRIRYNKNRTLLTAIAIVFTTILLMALGTCAVGIADANGQFSRQAGDQHATFTDLSGQQLKRLIRHMDVEAVETSEPVASVEYDKMNGFLHYLSSPKGEIYRSLGNLIEGRRPEKADEICGPAAFFERMGVEPAIGNTITISFRPGGTGALDTKTFTICGLVSQADMSKLDINDTRVAYSAYVSEAFLKEYISDDARLYRTNIRALGEDTLNYDEMRARIQDIAEDIGYDSEKIIYNSGYLMTALDAGSEMIGTVIGLGAVVVIFSGLVIYSIYYVSVITDVQEIGKLKALGASARQIKGLLLREGMAITLMALPIGLVLGYLIPRLLLPFILQKAMDVNIYSYKLEHIHMLSPLVVLAVILAVLITIYISLQKPMRMASRISPIEAIRYQESSTDCRGHRRGYDTVSVSRLCFANLTRNRKRTIVTMVTMGLSCVLFMSLAGLLCSMSAEDMARRSIETGDFRIELNYSVNDTVYPENNLNSLQIEDHFGQELMDRISSINGVKSIESASTLLAGAELDTEMFKDGDRATISPVTRETAEKYAGDLEQGSIDYDRMVEEHGVIFTADYFIEDYGLAVGDVLPLTIYDGNRTIPLDVRIDASLDLGAVAYFLIPEEIWDELDLEYSAVTDLYISVDAGSYDSVKAQLKQLVDEDKYFVFYSLDEELNVGAMSVALIKYPLYAILLIIAVISFINLINTMVTSIVTRKKELGILQALGLSDRQLVKMLAGEGVFFIAGTLLLSVTLGNFFGYLIFLWGKKSHFMSVSAYHYPLWETVGLLTALILSQVFITLFISRRVRRESLVDRIRSSE